MTKRIFALALGSMLVINFTAQAGPGDADQKWLGVVQKMIAKGETSIPTNSEQRLALLKDWAVKRGYAIMVGKNKEGYHVELFPKIVQR